MAKRILFWVIFVGAIGGLLESKAAIIEFQKILRGILAGGAVGFFIAMMVNVFSVTKRPQSNKKMKADEK